VCLNLRKYAKKVENVSKKVKIAVKTKIGCEEKKSEEINARGGSRLAPKVCFVTV